MPSPFYRSRSPRQQQPTVDDRPLVQAYQQEAQATSANDSQAMQMDVIRQEQQKDAAAARQMRDSQVQAAKAQAITVKTAKAQGIETQVDPITAKEAIKTRDDGSPVWQPGFTGAPRPADNGHVVDYRDPTGQTFTVPLSQIRRKDEPTGGIYEFDVPGPDGKPQAIRRAEEAGKPLFKVDKTTGQRFAEAVDPVTGGLVQQPLGMDPVAANAAAIETRKTKWEAEKANRSFAADELRLQQQVIEQQNAPARERLAELERKAKDFETGIRYEETPNGLMRYRNSGDDMPTPPQDETEIVKAKAFLENRRITKAELAKLAAEQEPVTKQLQEMELKRRETALSLLRDEHATRLEVAALEDAAKKGSQVWEPESQRRITAAVRSPEYTRAQVEAQAEGTALADDITAATRNPAMDSIADAMGSLGGMSNEGIGADVDGSALQSTPGELRLAAVLGAAPSAKGGVIDSTKALGIAKPEDFDIRPGEQPALVHRATGEDIGIVDAKAGRLLLTPSAIYGTEAGRRIARDASAESAPVFVLSGGAPFTPRQRGEFLAAATQAAQANDEAALSAAGADLPGIRRAVKDGKISIQDGKWIAKNIHGVDEPDLTPEGANAELSRYVAASKIEQAMWQGPQATPETRAAVVDRFMDRTASKAQGSLFYSGLALEGLRGTLKAQHAGKGAVNKVTDWAADTSKMLVGSLAGLGANVLANAGEALAEGVTLGEYRTSERGKLFAADTGEWLRNASGFSRRVFGGNDQLRSQLGDLRNWAASSDPGDVPPADLVEKLAQSTFSAYHALETDAEAKERMTNADTFSITKDPALAKAFSAYLETRNPAAWEQVKSLMTMDTASRALAERVQAYITKPRAATMDEVKERAAVALPQITDLQAKILLDASASPDAAAVKRVAGALGLEEADAALALDLFTGQTATDPQSLYGYFRAGSQAGLQEIALEAASTALSFGFGKLAARGFVQAAKGTTIAAGRRAVAASWVATQAADLVDDFTKMGMLRAKFGQPLGRGARLSNAVVTATKAVSGDMVGEGFEEGTVAIGEAGSDLSTVFESAGAGALAAPLMVGGMTVLALPQELRARGAATRNWEAQKKSYLEAVNKRLSATPGTEPFTPAEFEMALSLYGGTAAQADAEAVASAFAAMDAGPQTPQAQMQMLQAVTTAKAREALAVNAAVELRDVPEQQRTPFVAATKAALGVRDFTLPEAQALLALGGSSAVRFTQAPGQVGGDSMAVTDLAGGRQRLAPGVAPVVPPEVLTEAAQASPSLGELLGMAPQPAAPQVSPAPVAGATPVSPTPAAKGTAKGSGVSGNAPATPAQGGVGPAQGAPTATPAGGAPAIPPFKAAPKASIATLPDGRVEVKWTGKGDAAGVIMEAKARGFEVSSRKTVTQGKTSETTILLRPPATPTPQPAATPTPTPAPQANTQGVENIARQVVAQITARDPKLAQIVKEAKKVPDNGPGGGMWTNDDIDTAFYHLPTLVSQLSRFTPQQIGQRIEALIDEEIRHIAHNTAAKRLWTEEQRVLWGKPANNPLKLKFTDWLAEKERSGAFKVWRAKRYAEIWDDFSPDMQAKVDEVYGATMQPGEIDAIPTWKKAMEGLRMLDQLRATKSITELVLAHLEGVLEFLRDVLTKATPAIQREIDAIQAILLEFGYEQGAVKPEKAKTKPATAKKKEAVATTPKSSTQFTLSPAAANPFLTFGESIPKKELFDSIDPEWSDGALETEPHVTVLYGLTKHDAAPVAKAIKDHGPVTVTLGKLSIFENDQYDVLKVDIEGPELRALNAKLTKLPHESTFPDYQPHMTIAYLKKGEGKKYVGDTRFEGQTITFNTMTFSPPSSLRGEMGKPELSLVSNDTKPTQKADQTGRPFDPVSQAPLPAAKVKELREALDQARRWAGERMGVGFEMRIDDYERGSWTLQKHPSPADTLNDIKAEITKRKSKWAVNHVEELGRERTALVAVLRADSSVMDMLNNPSNSGLIHDYLGKKASDFFTDRLVKSADLRQYGMIYDHFSNLIENPQWTESVARQIRKEEAAEKPVVSNDTSAPAFKIGDRVTADEGTGTIRNLTGDMSTGAVDGSATKLKPTTPPRPAESADAAYLKAQEDTRAALGGLFSAPAPKRSIPQLEVSEERFDAVRKAAVSIIAAKIRTPQAFAKFMDDTFPGGKARPYSEAIWDLMGIADKTLRGTHDWSAIYAEIDTPLPDVVEPAVDDQVQEGQTNGDDAGTLVQRPDSPENGNADSTGDARTEGAGDSGRVGSAESDAPTTVGDRPLTDPQSAGSANDENAVGGTSPTGRDDAPVGSGDSGAVRDHDQPPALTNYVITKRDDLGSGSIERKFEDNLTAIELLKRLEVENRQPTHDEQAMLVRYVGWGGMKQAFNADAKGWEKRHTRLKAALTPAEYDAAARSTMDAHYTSETIIKNGIWGAMKRFGFTGGKMLEGGVGIGHMLGFMPAEIRPATSYMGIEKDSITARIAGRLYPEARILEMGFEKAAIEVGHFDGAVGNPPFGSQSLYDPQFKDISRFSIHNYFIAKHLEALRPGAVASFVVSHYFLDALDPSAREHIAKKARFLGAIRLPNNAFQQNANTKVTTDIVYFVRTEEGSGNTTGWTTATRKQDAEGNVYSLNEWIEQRPDMILGEMTTDHGLRAIELVVKPRPGQNLADELAGAVAKLPENVCRQAGEQSAAFEAREPMDVPDVPVGGFFIDASGALQKRLNDVNMERQSAPMTLPDATTERIKGMVGIREAFNKLVAAELRDEGNDAMDAYRKALNAAYDSFVKKHGFLNQQANRRAFYPDPQSARILGLEQDFNPGISKQTAKKKGVEELKPSAKKADIFTKRVNVPFMEITEVGTAKEALTASLNQRGTVDMPYMEQISGKELDELMDELDGLIFESPFGGYEVKEKYLSGNVRRKLMEARDAAENSPRFEANVKALEAVQPPDLEPSQVSVTAGAPFVPGEVMKDFAEALIGSRPQVAVYVPANGGWVFQHDADTAAATQEWGTESADFGELFQNILNGKPTVIYERSDDDKKVVNTKATELARSKENAIKDKWRAWIWEDVSRAEKLLRLYNDIYNVYVDPKYDGSHLTLPGLSAAVTLRPHQKNVVWRIINDLTTLLDHVVGAGKTFAGIAAFMELRRVGRVRKPLFAVPNHLVTQWRDDFIKLYPNANVLFAHPSDFAKDKRQLLFAKIMSGEYDAVIIGHSSLKKIGMSPAIEQEMLNEMLAEITATMQALADAEGRTGTRAQTNLQRQKETIESKLARLADKVDSGGRDSVANFEELGIDALFVDEAHEFKNLFYTTQMTRVAGLGNAAGSAKAFDLYLKTRYLRQRYSNRAPIVFATGTPISNSLVEMFTMQRYLQPQELERMDIATFDAWAKVYGQVEQVEEVDPTGTSYRVSTRLAKFQNVGDLAMNYRTFADVITMTDLKAQAEAQTGPDGKPGRFPVPKVKGGKPQNIIVPRTPEQAEYYGVETERTSADGEPILDADGMPQFDYPEGTINWRVDNMPDDPREDNMLKLTNDARKAALDMRLINPASPDRQNSKVNVAVKNILQVAKEWEADRGTQLVFCDLSIPASARGKAKAKAAEKLAQILWIVNPSKGGMLRVEAEPFTVKGYEFQFHIRKERKEWLVTERSTGRVFARGASKSDAQGTATAHVQAHGDAITALLDQQRPDEAELAAFLAEQEEADRANQDSDEADNAEEESVDSVSVDELLAEQSKFSVYDDIKAKLIAGGMKEEEVAFIHDFDTPEKKSKLFARVNRGEVRVLMGSTPKLGAGTNVQRKLVALHHLDAPWRPSDLEQREGRIIRQGNEFYERDPDGFEVRALRYATKLTYDTRMWQIIEHKASGIEGFRKADRNTRIMEDVSGEAANAADMKAAASGDPRIQREIALRGEITKLRNLRDAFNDNRQRLVSKVKYLAESPQRLESVRAHYKTLIDYREANTPEKFVFLTPSGKALDQKGDVLEGVVNLMKAAKNREEVSLGRYRGFIVLGEKRTTRGRDHLEISMLKIGVARTNAFNVADFGPDDSLSGVGLIQRLDNKLESFEGRIELEERQSKQYEAERADLEPQLSKTFMEGQKLESLTAEHDALKAELRGSRRRVADDGNAEPTALLSAPAPRRDDTKLKDALQKMPEIWRKVLEAKMRGDAIPAIATANNISEVAVGNVLRVAEGRLRTLLAQASATKPTVRVEGEAVKAASGRPDLAMSGNPTFIAADQRRTIEEVTHAEMNELAGQMFAEAPEAAEAFVVRWMDSGTTNMRTDDQPPAIQRAVAEAQARMAAEMLMTAAAKLLVTDRAMKGGDAFQTARLIELYRNTGTEQARALGMRQDPFLTPEERAAMYIAEALLTPPESMRNDMRRNPANKENILKKWARKSEQLKADLKAAGMDIDATFAALRREKAAAERAIPVEVKTPLARAGGRTQRLVRAVLEGKTWREAAEAAKMTLEQARKAYNSFRAQVNETGSQAAQAARDALLRSAPAPGADFAAQIGLPEWTEEASPDATPVKTEVTETLKKERTRKKVAGEIDLKNPVAVARVETRLSTFKSSTFDKFSEFWRASILSGPQTQVVNLSSGLAFGIYETAFKKLGVAALADAARLFGMKPDAASLADIPAMVAATKPAISAAFRDAIRAWKAETSFFDAYARDHRDDTGLFKGESFNPALKGPVGTVMRSISFRLMLLADEFVKSFFTRIEVAAKAREIARSEGLKGEAMANRIAELLTPGSIAWVRALDNSLKITFQTPLKTNNGIVDQIDGLAEMIQNTKEGKYEWLLKGVTHFVFPFVSTPTNIFKMGVQMSPLGTFTALIDAGRSLNESRKGNTEEAARLYNAARLFDDMVNQIVAWGVLMAVSDLVMPGDDEDELPFITGTMSWKATREGERQLAYRTAPPMSIRIGGRWWSYGRLDPFATSLAFIVDTVKEFNKGAPLDETWGKVAIQMMTTMQDKTFLQGFSDLMNAFEQPERAGTRWATNIVTGFVLNLIRQPIRSADENIRENDLPNDIGFMDAMRTRVGYSIIPQAAPPAIDVWGRPEVKGTNTGSPQTDTLLRLFSPAQSRGLGPDPLDVAILRYNLTADKPIAITAPDRELRRTAGKTVIKASLTDEEWGLLASAAGRTARMMIGQRFNGRNLTDDDAEFIRDVVKRAHDVHRETWKRKKLTASPPAQ